ncbi:centromere protein v [Emericellopsis cladophorae]|uniref:Centromere protein v n=1 Tax=Emericellopsis cladophorae TaxID=2686198 RepID=A0A9P9Y242_9HYPO|nr:centromere protein v [Emericellopsis cladophorae]KAI6781529.1 centromere protein v [Emericellopsis cladophorae]
MTAEAGSSATYNAGCHCGHITFSVTLSPPLPEQQVFNCNCSICRSAGYLIVYLEKDEVEWHNDSRPKCMNYQFNTKKKDQMFCPKCGVSIGIDFRRPKTEDPKGKKAYGISVRTFYGIDLDTLNYQKLDGLNQCADSSLDFVSFNSPDLDLDPDRGSPAVRHNDVIVDGA